MSEQPPEQIRLMQQMVDMSAQRTEMSAERCYQNAERTLLVWVRTALALMVFGIAIDRFGLLLHRLPGHHAAAPLSSNSLSNWCGFALVILGVLVTVITGIRFVSYARAYRRVHSLPARHGPYLAAFFSIAVAVFGLALLAILFSTSA